MDGFGFLGVIAAITTIVSFLSIVATIVFVVFAFMGQWRLHKILGCRWAWYIFFPVLNRIQILEMMKSEDDTIEVAGKQVPYHIMSLYEYAGSLVTALLGFVMFIPFIGGLLVTAASLFVTGFVGRYYNARVIALLYGESPDDYEPYLKTGFWWSIFPFLPYFWLKKNV